MGLNEIIIESPKECVKFSRFEIIHRYSWVGPVGGFQTRIEKKNAILEFRIERRMTKRY